MFVLIARPLVFVIALLLAGQAQAQAPAAVPPERVKQLFELLDDPSVKAWVAEQRNQDAGSTGAPAEAAASPTDAPSDAVAAPGPMNTMASSTLDRIKHHIEKIVRTLPTLPGQFARVRANTMDDMSSRGPVGILVLIAIFIAAGLALTWAIYKLTRPFRLWVIAQPKDTPIGRTKKIGGRTLYSSMMIGSFALGSAGAFMLFDWPMLIREIVLTFLMAAVFTWAVRIYVMARSSLPLWRSSTPSRFAPCRSPTKRLTIGPIGCPGSSAFSPSSPPRLSFCRVSASTRTE